jgi:Rrf2 family protein
MPLVARGMVARHGMLAVAAVTEIALNSRTRPVSSKALATRHRLPPRHLERVLQALAREGVLKGTRGRRGGYQLGREQHMITAEEILRIATTVDEGAEAPGLGAPPLSEAVGGALARAEEAFSTALARISIADLTRSAMQLGGSEHLAA